MSFIHANNFLSLHFLSVSFVSLTISLSLSLFLCLFFHFSQPLTLVRSSSIFLVALCLSLVGHVDFAVCAMNTSSFFDLETRKEKQTSRTFSLVSVFYKTQKNTKQNKITTKQTKNTLLCFLVVLLCLFLCFSQVVVRRKTTFNPVFMMTKRKFGSYSHPGLLFSYI